MGLIEAAIVLQGCVRLQHVYRTESPEIQDKLNVQEAKVRTSFETSFEEIMKKSGFTGALELHGQYSAVFDAARTWDFSNVPFLVDGRSDSGVEDDARSLSTFHQNHHTSILVARELEKYLTFDEAKLDSLRKLLTSYSSAKKSLDEIPLMLVNMAWVNLLSRPSPSAADMKHLMN